MIVIFLVSKFKTIEIINKKKTTTIKILLYKTILFTSIFKALQKEKDSG